MIFNFKKSNISPALRFPINTVYFLLSISLVFFFLFSFFYIFPKTGISPQIRGKIGWGIVFAFEFIIIFLIGISFYEFKLKKYGGKTWEELNGLIDDLSAINLADYLDLESAKILKKTISYCRRKKISPVSLTVLSYYLFQSKNIEFVFRRLGVDYKTLFSLRKYLELAVQSIKSKKDWKKSDLEFSDEFKSAITYAAQFAVNKQKARMSFGDLLSGAVYFDSALTAFWREHGIKIDDIPQIVMWHDFFSAHLKYGSVFSEEHLGGYKGIGKGWAYGSTLTLDLYSHDLTQYIESEELRHHMFGRKAEITEIERILLREGNGNVVLVGEAGVGVYNVVDGLARLIMRGGALAGLNYKRVVQLDMDKVFAGAKDQFEIVSALNKILNEAATAGNVILVIDDIHNYLGVGGGIGALDIGEILIPFLKSANLQLIGVTNPSSYYGIIEKNPSFSSLFEKVEIREPSEQESTLILEDMLIDKFEKKYGIIVSFPAVRTIIELCSTFIVDTPFPEKAITILKDTLIYAKSNKIKIVLPDSVYTVVSQKTGLPLGKVEAQEKEKLLNLENLIHKRIIGQDEAVRVISESMRRSRAGISEKKKPIGTFLFMGPTGVGKTETAKALAEIYFGSEDKMIRLDMTEYRHQDSLKRLIGSRERASDFVIQARENPFSLILLDEFEKAHPDILNLFLQILDEGRLTAGDGKKVSFLNTIIIGTSNAGSEFIRQYIQKGKDVSQMKVRLIDELLREGIFRPELLNRFDAAVVFYPLTGEEMKKIAEIMLKKLAKRLKKKDLGLKITEELIVKTAEAGYDPVFGGRAMKRMIQEKIEAKIAEKILRGEFERGEEVVIDPDDI